ncbi:MAG: AarF/UbiB family protein [Fusobacteriaceae bacterium]
MNTLNFLGLIHSFKVNRYPKLEKIANMGLLGVRIAQEYSRRIDILSEEMCYYLLDVHSSLLPADPKHFLRMVKPRSDIFYNLEFYDNEPFAYSHVTQVYRGTLKDGTECGIKVIDRKSKKDFLDDIYGLEKGVKLFSKISPVMARMFFAKDIVENIKESTLEKIDLRREIKYTNYFAGICEDYRDDYELTNLKFPKIYKEISSEHYIVGEYISGGNVKELLNDKKMKYNKFLEIMRYHLFYIFVIGSFHSDIHAGNIIIGENGEIYFIDCNSITEIDDEFRSTFYTLLISVCDENYDEINRCIKKLSRNLIPDTKYLNFKKKSKEIKGSKFSHKIMSLFRIASENGMVFDNNLFSVLKAFIRLEEIAYKTLPKAFFVKDLREELKRYGI